MSESKPLATYASRSDSLRIFITVYPIQQLFNIYAICLGETSSIPYLEFSDMAYLSVLLHVDTTTISFKSWFWPCCSNSCVNFSGLNAICSRILRRRLMVDTQCKERHQIIISLNLCYCAITVVIKKHYLDQENCVKHIAD